MAKYKFIKTTDREIKGETFFFHIYEDTRMLHVFGNGDKQSTGKADDSDTKDFVINNLIAALLTRGNCSSGAFPVPH